MDFHRWDRLHSADSRNVNTYFNLPFPACVLCLNMMRGLYVFIVVTLLLVYCYSFIEFKLIFQNPGILLILN